MRHARLGRPRTWWTPGMASARSRTASTWTFDAINRLGKKVIADRYGATSSTCTRTSPARTRTSRPMRIYPASHYTMGGLWVDYNLESTIPGLFVIGEANFSDRRRPGASALMQGLADGYFVCLTRWATTWPTSSSTR
ncbi:MAG: FAD-binding protein [Caldilineaceae bacterium]